MRGPPSTATIERAISGIATGAIAVASALLGAVTVGIVMDVIGADHSPGIAPSTAALGSTFVLAAHVAWRATRSDHPVMASVGRAALAGVLNVPLAVVLVAASSWGELARLGPAAFVVVPAGLLVAAVVASPLGVVLGFAFGVAFAPLVAVVRDDLAYRDLGAPARTAIASGIWLLAIAALAALAAAWDAEWATLSALACGALGAGLTIAGTIARARRRRRLARIARGEVPGWAIVMREVVQVEEDLPLYDRGVLGDRVMVRVEEAGVGAYRSAEAHVPIAAVPDESEGR